MSLLVPFDELLKTSRTCGKDDEITLESTGPQNVTIKYSIGRQLATNTIESAPVEEFPGIPRIKGAPVPVEDSLRATILEALECSSTDETRPVLNGAFIDVSDSKCHHVVGTDGRHLFSSNSFRLPLKTSLIIPNHKFLSWKEFEQDDQWRLRTDPDQKSADPQPIEIGSRRWRFISKPIDGNYPDWRQVIPNPARAETGLEIPEEALENVIETIHRMPCHDGQNFVIGIELAQGRVFLLGKALNAEKWLKVEMKEIKSRGKDMHVFMNRNMFTKALSFGLGQIAIIDSTAAVTFSNQGRQMVVMPVRVEYQPGDVTDDGPVAEIPRTPAVTEPVAASENGENQPAVESPIENVLTLVETLEESTVQNLNALEDLGSKLKWGERIPEQMPLKRL